MDLGHLAAHDHRDGSEEVVGVLGFDHSGHVALGTVVGKGAVEAHADSAHPLLAGERPGP